MPTTYFSSNKVLWFSAEFPFRCSQRGLIPSHSFSSLVDSIQAFPITHRPTAQSIDGTLSRLFSVPSLPSPSCHLRVHNIVSVVSESTQSSSCILFKMNITSVCNPLPRGPKAGAHRQSRDALVSSPILDVCYPTKSLDCCRRISKISRTRELWNSSVVFKCFWFNAIGKKCLSSNPYPQSEIKELCSSFFTSCPTGAAPDVSLYRSPREEQLDNPSSSSDSDQKKSSNRALKLLSGSCYLPHPDKEEIGGEDAYFIWDEQAIGVADGVGGWINHGIDAGQYSRALMSHSVEAIEEEPQGSIDPLRVLEKAYARTKAEGSSTACIIALTNQGIHAVNLGDSGFIVVRDGCTLFRSPVQQHDFNFTYQLESGNASDLPSSAQVFTVPVESDDIIVAGTDGLFDNLYNNEITAVVVHGIRAGLGPQVMAQKMAALARQRAQDKDRQTPFSTAAQDAGYRYHGGKLDDITVVVSCITAFGT